MEFKHHSWFTDEATAVLRRWNICRVAMHVPRAEATRFGSAFNVHVGAGASLLPPAERALSTWTTHRSVSFVRLHGAVACGAGDYGARFLRALAHHVHLLSSCEGQRHVIISFANVESAAPLSSAIVSARILSTQMVKFFFFFFFFFIIVNSIPFLFQ